MVLTMFDLFGMIGNYNLRKVDNTKIEGFTLDTCRVTDSIHPYETALKHENINDGNWIIIKQYNTEEEAAKGHRDLVDYIKNNNHLEFDNIHVWENRVIEHYTFDK